MNIQIDKTDSAYQSGFATGQNGGRYTKTGERRYNPYGDHGVSWHHWNVGYADGARAGGYEVKTDWDGRHYID